MSTRMHIVVSDELLAKIDASLGPGQARADFVRRAVERALVTDRGSSEDARVSSASVPAPAEQPDDALREVHQELRQESRTEAFRRAAGKK